MWLAHYSGWGTHFVGLSAWTSSQTSHTATAYLPTIQNGRHTFWHTDTFWHTLTHSDTHPETYQQLFSRSPYCFLFALFQNKRSLSLYTFLFYIHQFYVSSSFCVFCLARCKFRLFPNFRWDALWGIYSDVTLPYLPTSVWGWPSSFEDLYESTWYFWSCLFCS